VAEDQPLSPGRRPAVLAGGDLAIGAADSEHVAVHEELAVPRFRLIDVDDGGRPRLPGDDGERTHRAGQPMWCGVQPMGNRRLDEPEPAILRSWPSA